MPKTNTTSLSLSLSLSLLLSPSKHHHPIPTLNSVQSFHGHTHVSHSIYVGNFDVRAASYIIKKALQKKQFRLIYRGHISIVNGTTLGKKGETLKIQLFFSLFFS